MANLMHDGAPAAANVSYVFPVGAEVAFAKKAGVARGTVRAVEIRVSAGEPIRRGSPGPLLHRVVYVIESSHRDPYGVGKTHTERIPESRVKHTLDEAWKAHETSAFDGDDA